MQMANATRPSLAGSFHYFDKLPKPNFEDKVNGTQKFFSELNRVGVTGVIDPGGFNMSPTEYAPLFKFGEINN
jgi:predicted amidohydrolase YtcJ